MSYLGRLNVVFLATVRFICGKNILGARGIDALVAKTTATIETLIEAQRTTGCWRRCYYRQRRLTGAHSEPNLMNW